MPKGVEPKVYPPVGKKRGVALHEMYPPIGDSLGNAMHKAPRNTGGRNNKTALGTWQDHTGPPEPRPRKRNRGPKPPSRALPGTPQMGKSGGSLAGQTMGKIG